MAVKKSNGMEPALSTERGGGTMCVAQSCKLREQFDRLGQNDGGRVTAAICRDILRIADELPDFEVVVEALEYLNSFKPEYPCAAVPALF